MVFRGFLSDEGGTIVYDKEEFETIALYPTQGNRFKIMVHQIRRNLAFAS